MSCFLLSCMTGILDAIVCMWTFLKCDFGKFCLSVYAAVVTILFFHRQEAILRGAFNIQQVVRLMLLQNFSTNVFVSLFFSWNHDGVIFTLADKMSLLYVAVLATFLVQTFFFEEESM